MARYASTLISGEAKFLMELMEELMEEAGVLGSLAELSPTPLSSESLSRF